MRNPRPGKGLVGGLLIVAIGVIFLLDQQGIVSAGHVFRIFWPVFFILLGFEDLLAGYSERKRTWGTLLVAFGSILLLNQLGYIHVRIALLWPLILIGAGVWILLSNYGVLGPHPWPLGPWHYGHREPPNPNDPTRPNGQIFGPDGILGPRGPLGPHGPLGPYGPLGPHGPIGSAGPIPQAPPAQTGPEATNPQPPYQTAPGFASGAPPQDPREWRRWQKWEARRQRHAWRHQWANQTGGPYTGTGFDSNDAQFNYSVIVSHVERNITSKNFKSGSLSAIFGGFDINLTHAEIEGDEAVIHAEAFFGGGEIRIPETWHVVIEGNALFGAFIDETRQRPPEGTTPAKRLVIRGTAVFGGISIKN